MMTLKLEQREFVVDPEARKTDPMMCQMRQAWIAGVRQVVHLGAIAPDDWPGEIEEPGSPQQYEIWCWSGPEVNTLRTKLMVSTVNDELRFLVVERAWLLGPDGGTIERIAP